MKKEYILLCIFVFIIFGSFAQTGKEFWFVAPEVTSAHNDRPIVFRVATSDSASIVTVTMPAQPAFVPITVSLAANSSSTIDLTPFINNIENKPANTVLNNGLLITATQNITAYYEVNNSNNNEFFSLKGASALGTEFYTPFQTFFNNANFNPTAYAAFDIVATEDNTTILIYPKTNIIGHNALASFTITLNKGQTWSGANPTLLAANNPSGTIILSDKPIAVTIKSDSDANPPGSCLDLEGDQIVPVDIIGTDYIAVNSGVSNERVFILATQNNTVVNINGTYQTTLFGSETYGYALTQPYTYISASKPVYVLHLSGFGCELGSAILPPLNCAGSQQISFVRSTSEFFGLNLLVKNGSQGNFVLNGSTTLIKASDFSVVPGTGNVWVAARISFNTTDIPIGTANLITNTASIFSMGIINGGATTGARYGYFSEFKAPIKVNAGTDQLVCANALVNLSGTVTGGATTGIWTSTGTGTFVTSNTNLNAVYKPSLSDLATGNVTFTLTSTSVCFPQSDDVKITFTPAPTADAGPDQVLCANNPKATLAGKITISLGGVWTGGSGSFNPNNTTLNAVYTPTAAEITSGSVMLKLTSTGNGNCVAISDSLVLSFTAAPTVNAGPDQSVCANKANITLAGSSTVAGGIAWSGGSGVYNPSNTVSNAVYTPTSGEITSGSLTLTLTTTGNGNCIAVTDDVKVTFTLAPVVAAGPDQVVCSNNAAISLSGTAGAPATGLKWTGGLGGFAPSNTSGNIVYTPTSSEILSGGITFTLSSTGNGNCLAVTDNIAVTFTATPEINAGPDQTVCSNNANVTLNGSGLLFATGAIWSGGLGAFNPNNTTLNAVYTPAASEITAGTVSLTLTTTGNGNCNPVSDVMKITITPAPTANAGADQNICNNNPQTTLNGSITTATGGIWTGGAGSFTPGSTVLNSVYTPTPAEVASGSLILTLTTTGNGSCTAVNDAMKITFTSAPLVNAGVDQSICSNKPQTTLSGSVGAPATGGTWTGGSGSFSPSNTSVGAVYTPTSAEILSGNIILTLTSSGNGNCLAVLDNVAIAFTPSPNINAGTDQTVCANNPAVSLNPSGLAVATGIIWSGGGGGFSPNNTTLNAVYTPTAAEITAGTVSLTITTTGNGNCNAVADVMKVTITPAPTVNAGPDQSICANNPGVTLSGSLTTAGGGVWSGGSGSYSSGSTALTTIYTPTAAEISSGSLTLTLTTTSNGSCTAVSDAMKITFTPAPVVNGGADQSICSNNSKVTLSGSVGAPATGGTWTGGLGSFSPANTALGAVYTPTSGEVATGSLTLTLTSSGNGNCLAVSDNILISFTPAPLINAGIDQAVCANNPNVTLTASGLTVASGVSWSGGLGSFNPNSTSLSTVYTPTAAEIAGGTVSLTITTTGNSNCTAVSDVMKITITPAPTVNAGADQSICANNPGFTLSGALTTAGGGVWSGGAGSYSSGSTALTTTYTPTAAEISLGSLTLTLTTTSNGSCNAVSDAMKVTFTPAPVVNAGSDQSICSNNSKITLSGSISVPASGGIWSGGLGSFSPANTSAGAVYTPTSGEVLSGNLTLTLTSSGNGNCLAVADNVLISFTPAPQIDAGPDQTVCANNLNITLGGTGLSVASGAVWTGGLGSFNPGNTTLNAIYTPTTAEITAGVVSLTLTTTGNGNCTAVSDLMKITITPAPTVSAGADQSICANNAVVSLSGAVTTAGGGIWSGGAGTYSSGSTGLINSYTPKPSEIAVGSLTLTLTTTGNGNCTPVSDVMKITFTPAPVVNAGPDQSICSNNSKISLSGSVSAPATGSTWTGGVGSFSPANTSAGAVYTPTSGEVLSGNLTLTLTSSGNGNCLAVSDNVLISFTPAPQIDAGPDLTVCANNLNITLGGTGLSVASGAVWAGGLGTFNPGNTTLNATYTPTAAEITAGLVSLTLTTTGNGNCTAVSDVMKITITPAPTVSAGADQSICANKPAVTLGGSVTVATGGIWTGGAGTYSPGSAVASTTYTPTPAEIATGSLILTFTTTGNGTCTALSDAMKITFTTAPVVNAGTDQSICSNNANITLSGSVSAPAAGGIWTGGSGSFSPSNSSLATVYTPTSTEILSGNITLTLNSSGNGNCLAVSDNISIAFTPSPTISAGVDQTVCANNPSVTLAATGLGVATGIVWSGGLGSYNPNNTALNAVYTPKASEISAGTVSLTITTSGNGGCNPVTDVMKITITPAPTVNAGPDQSICDNNPKTILTGSVSTAAGGIWSGGAGTYSPAGNVLATVYTPTASEITAGSLILTLTTTGNGNCTAVSDQMKIAFTPAPLVNAGPDQSICTNNPVANLGGVVGLPGSGGIWTGGSGSFSPSNTSLSAVYTPTSTEISSGILTLTLTSSGNGNCIAVSDNMKIAFTPSPSVNAGTDQTVCANNANVTLKATGLTVASGVIWSGGLGSYNPNNTSLNAVYTPTTAEITAGTVSLTVTTTGNGNCTPVSDVIKITITPAPIVNAGADVSACVNNPSVSLSGTVQNAGGGLWSGGTGTFIPGNLTLNSSYTPSDDEITTGTAFLTLTSTGNGNCNAVSDQMKITLTPAPTVNAGADQTLCANNADISLNGSVTVASGGQWSGGLGTFNPGNTSMNAVYTPTTSEISSGSITLKITSTGNGLCNAVSDNVTINFTAPPDINAGFDKTICANNASASLSGTVTIATGGTWSGGSGIFVPDNTSLNTVYQPSPSEISAGTVDLTLTSTGNGNCIAVSDVVTISITPAPIAQAGPDLSSCVNNASVTLAGSIQNASGGSWSGGTGIFNPSGTSLSTTYIPSAAEISAGFVNLTLISTGNGNCNAVSDAMKITINPAPSVSAGPDQTACANNAKLTLNGVIGLATGGKWSGGLGTYTPGNTSLNMTYVPTSSEIASGTLTLTLTSTGNGSCSQVSDDVSITFTPSPDVDAGLDQTVCANNSGLTLNGSVSVATGGIWSGGLGTFSPDNNTLNAVYVPSPSEMADGSFTLVLTSNGNGNCKAVSDQVTISVLAAPLVNAGTDLVSCKNNPSVTLSGSVQGSTGGKWSGGSGVFNLSANALNAVYIPSTAEINAGNVILTLTSTGNGSCNEVTDDVKITINPAPTVDAGADIIACGNNSDVKLSGAVTLATGAIWSGGLGIFTPNSNMLDAVYSPTAFEIASGSLSLTLTSSGNGNCNAATDNVTILFTPSPTIDAGANQSVCANNAATTLNGSVNVASGGIWSGGLGTFTPGNTALNAVYNPTDAEISNGQVTLTLTSTGNGGCKSVSNSMDIIITQSPFVNAGPPQTVCVDNLSVVLNGFVSGKTNTGKWTTKGTGTFLPGPNVLNTSYKPSPADSLSGEVQLFLTSTNNGNCKAVSDTTTLFILPAGNVNAGSDQTVCSNNANVALSGIVSGGATTGIWFTSGSGKFTPDNKTLNASYTPSPADTAAGKVTLTLSANSCNFAKDDLILTINPSAIVDAGQDQIVCLNDLNIQLDGKIAGSGFTGLWSSTGTGTFIPDRTTLNAVYKASKSDSLNSNVVLMLTSPATSTCKSVTDTINIRITTAGSANAGPDQNLCGNNAEVALAGSVGGGADAGVWSSPGTGVFTPSRADLTTTYIPSGADIANGSIILTLTSNGCDKAANSVKINFTAAPLVDAGADKTSCANNADVSLSGSFTGATGAQWSTGGTGTFSPNTGLSVVYSPGQEDKDAGMVYVYLTTTGNGKCKAVTDSVKVSIIEKPVVDAGKDQSVCLSSVSTTLQGVITSVSGAGVWMPLGSGTLVPDANALDAVYVFSKPDSVAGAVRLVLTAPEADGCKAVSDTVKITFGKTTFVNAGADLTVCATDKSVSLNGFVTGGSETGIWTTSGSGTFFPNPKNLQAFYRLSPDDILSNTVELTLTSTNSGQCEEGQDKMLIAIVPPPALYAGKDKSICKGIKTIDLYDAVADVASVRWKSLGSGTFKNAFDKNTSYTFSRADSVKGSVVLVLNSENSLCLISDSMTISFGGKTFTDAGDDLSVCGSLEVIDVSGFVSGQASGGKWSTLGSGHFLQSDTVLNNSYLLSSKDSLAGLVRLVLTSANTGNGCSQSADTISITRKPAGSLSAGADKRLCKGTQSVQLLANTTNVSAIKWRTLGTGTFFPNDSVPGPRYIISPKDSAAGFVTMVLSADATNGCEVISDSIKITVSSPVAPGFTYVNACADQHVYFTDTTKVFDGSISSRSWNFGDANTSASKTPSYVFPAIASYTVTLTVQSSLGCKDSITKQVIIRPRPIAGFKLPAVTPKTYENIEFIDLSQGANAWAWSFGDDTDTLRIQSPSHIYEEASKFTVFQVVRNEYNCTDTASIELKVIGNAVLPPKLPNAFSPNGDGNNDIFKVRGGPFKTVNLKIYNGWGEMIYESTDPHPDAGWDGTFKGVKQPMGVYVYTVQATTLDDKEYSKSGDVTLIK